jgi:hypothetical protein
MRRFGSMSEGLVNRAGAVAYRLMSGAFRLIERDLAGEALIDEPVKAFPFTPC